MAAGRDHLRDLGSGLLRGRRSGLLVLGVLVAVVAVVVLVLVEQPVVAVVAGVAAVLALPAVVLWLLGTELGEHRADALVTRDLHADLEARVDVLEQLLADDTRRPWSPTLLPWAVPTLPERPVVLVPAGDYHLPEIVGLAEELRTRDVPTVVAATRAFWPRLAEGLAAYPALELRELPAPDEVAGSARALVTMSDWGAARPYVEAAQAAGVPTFAKVEGACDYDDVDIPASGARHPYRTADIVLAQGRNDAEHLPGDTPIVGSSRLERLLWAPPARPHEDLVVVNLNFTYGVLADARRAWLESVVEACETAGRRYVISLHPAERARTPHPRAVPIGVSRLLERATLLVSRFSTAGFEAIARGVPFAYHNPHGEQVPTFLDPDGAFDVTTSAVGLVGVLERREQPGEQVRERGAAFLGAQVDVDPSRTAAQRAADVLVERLGA